MAWYCPVISSTAYNAHPPISRLIPSRELFSNHVTRTGFSKIILSQLSVLHGKQSVACTATRFFSAAVNKGLSILYKHLSPRLDLATTQIIPAKNHFEPAAYMVAP